MEDKPYTFDVSNPRLVANIQHSNMNVYYGAAALFLLSVRAYHKRIFRVDQNSLNLAAFTVGSALASYSYANYFLGDPLQEAATINNDKELQRSGH